MNAALAAVTYDSAPNFFGTPSVGIAIDDGANGPQGSNPTGSIDITVNSVNDTPTANAQTVSTNEDTNLPLTLTGADSDPEVTQTLTFAITDQPDHGTLTGFSASTGVVTYEPAANYNGPDSFQFTVTDDTIDHAADGSDLHIVGATQDSDLEIALDYAIGAAAVSSYGYVFNHDSYLEHTLAATGRTVPDLPDTTEFRKSR